MNTSQFICLTCSNGCMLKVNEQKAGVYVVSGNKCIKGVAFAKTKLRDLNGIFIPSDSSLNYDENELKEISKQWNIDTIKVHSGMMIQGSPERSIFRTVIADSLGNNYILEHISPEKIDNKKRIASMLSDFYKQNIKVNPYLQANNGEYVVNFNGKFWQLSKFPFGEKIDRHTYWQDEWRGEMLANFLVDLYLKTKNFQLSKPNFDLRNYINNLLNKIKTNKPEIFKEVSDIVDSLQKNLFSIYENIPSGFCHGDPHPMNVVWGDNQINCVIDWEFSGIKPCIYDIALIIGCVGAEAPDSLSGGFVSKFKETIEKSNIFNTLSINALPYLIVAVRFAWLSEWLRREDQEMIEFEIFYMNFLIDKHCSGM